MRWVAWLTVGLAVIAAESAVGDTLKWRGYEWSTGGGNVYLQQSDAGEAMVMDVVPQWGQQTSASCMVEPEETWGVLTRFEARSGVQMRFLVDGLDPDGVQSLVWVIFTPGVSPHYEVWWYNRSTGVGNARTQVAASSSDTLTVIPRGDRVDVLAGGAALVTGAKVHLAHVQGAMWNVTNRGASGGTSVSVLDVDLGLERPAIPVEVRIRPGEGESPLNPRSNGHLPVAVLGSEDLDMQLVDCSTVVLGKAKATHATFADVNGDEVKDLLLHFLVQDIGLEPDVSGSVEIVLEGETTEGELIRGSDTVRIVGRGQGKAKGRGRG